MTQKRPDLPSHPIWPTILILTAQATVTALAGILLAFMGNVFMVTITSGPFGWYAFGPALVQTYSNAFLIGLVVTPLWATLGGSAFANRAAGNKGSAASDMNVTFFSETHEIAAVTQRLAEKMGLPKIAHIGWFPGEEINAFAMGTSPYNALIAVSSGAVERLSKRELIAVLAHELGHVASRDMARMTYARGIQEGLTFFLIFQGFKKAARWMFTPLSELEILRLSRAREFTADRISAMMIGPENMISALEKLQNEEGQPRRSRYANVMIWSRVRSSSIFSTHPPLSQRIARLKAYQATAIPAVTSSAAPAPAIAE